MRINVFQYSAPVRVWLLLMVYALYNDLVRIDFFKFLR